MFKKVYKFFRTDPRGIVIALVLTLGLGFTAIAPGSSAKAAQTVVQTIAGSSQQRQLLASSASSAFVVPRDCSPRQANWAKPGRDPVWRGGAFNRATLRQALSSPMGRSRMRCAGLSVAVQNALIKGVSSAVAGTMPNNAPYPAGIMVGAHEVFVNGSLTGGPLANWTVRGILLDGSVVTVQFGMICVNVLPVSRTPAKQTTTTKSTKSAKKAPVTIVKIALDAFGHQLPATPTGTFPFQGTINGKKVYFVYNHPPKQLVGYCKVGSRVSMRELKPLSNEQWKLVSPKQPYLSMLCTKKGASFVYKNEEVPPTPATPTVTNINTVTQTVTTTTTTTTSAPKDGTPGAGSGSGGPGSGPGAGGSGNPSDRTGQICNLPNGDVGQIDRSGNCVPQNSGTTTSTTTTTSSNTLASNECWVNFDTKQKKVGPRDQFDYCTS